MSPLEVGTELEGKWLPGLVSAILDNKWWVKICAGRLLLETGNAQDYSEAYDYIKELNKYILMKALKQP